MGWTSGSQLAEEIWDLVQDYIPEEAKATVAHEIRELFLDRDCDNIDEAHLLLIDSLKNPEVFKEYIIHQLDLDHDVYEEYLESIYDDLEGLKQRLQLQPYQIEIAEKLIKEKIIRK